jgi:phospholipid/cholesterol/gamma-HCH transport system ATP-binding protein
MVGLLAPDSGEVYFHDTPYKSLGDAGKRALRQRIGMLFQGGALFDFCNVEENVMFPLKMFSNMSHREQLARAATCLARVNLVGVSKRSPSELSGGMQRRVAIARAIALRPRYLFCDEPNSGLDPQTAMLIDELIKEITQEYGITTVINTHDMNSVMGIGDKIIFIHQGKCWWTGNKDEAISADNQEFRKFIFANPVAYLRHAT